MNTYRRTLGFDRKLHLSWLEVAASWGAQGMAVAEVRSRLHSLLEGELAGEGPHCARGKTITVLMRVWVRVREDLEQLRSAGIEILGRGSHIDSLPLHWGMCIASYPFFRDVAATTGRLLRIQEEVALSQVGIRIAEAWGERSTVARAVQRVVRTFALWGVVAETGKRGVFRTPLRSHLRTPVDVSLWLLEAALSGEKRGARPLAAALSDPAIFPFTLDLSRRDLERSPRLEVHRDGLDGDLVLVRKAIDSKVPVSRRF